MFRGLRVRKRMTWEMRSTFGAIKVKLSRDKNKKFHASIFGGGAKKGGKFRYQHWHIVWILFTHFSRRKGGLFRHEICHLRHTKRRRGEKPQKTVMKFYSWHRSQDENKYLRCFGWGANFFLRCESEAFTLDVENFSNPPLSPRLVCTW